jgi:hypothetical protein
MISITVTFAGTEQDQNGMPEPYHHYYVAASENTPSTGYSTATICPTTARAPLPTSGPHMVSEGSATLALEKALNSLASLPQNEVLSESRGSLFKSPTTQK